jgi:hypothetical protein
LSFNSLSEFYQNYKNDVEAARKAAFQIGQDMGRTMIQKGGVKGNDLGAVADILNSAMRLVKGEPSARLEDDKVIMQNKGFCAIMRSALTLNIPWEWLDSNFAWPWLEGIVSIVRPDVRLSVSSARCRGDKACVHVFEIR